MKKCPYCAEKIQDETIVCRYCGKDQPAVETVIPSDDNLKKKKTLIVAGSILFILLMAAVVFFILLNKPDAENVYSENFNDPAALTDWDVKTKDQNTKVVALDGGYHFSVINGSVGSFLRGKNFSDSILSVDLTFLTTEPATVAIICRNDAGGYGFGISNDGKWTLDKSGKLLGSGETKAIKTGVNKIKVGCEGQQFTLEINNELVGAVNDPEFSHGEIGLGLSSSGKAEVIFDNLKIIGGYTLAEVPPGDEEPKTSTSITKPMTATPTPENTSNPNYTPTITVTPSPTPKGLYYFNDFEGVEVGLDDWIIHEKRFYYRHDQEQSEDYTFLENGTGKIFVDSEVAQPIYLIYDIEMPESDQIFSTDMEFEGTGNAMFSLICRYSAAGWYELGISSSGNWQIILAQVGAELTDIKYSTLAEGNSTSISSEANNIEASCIEDKLDLTVNGELLGSVEDQSIVGRILGLVYQEDPIGENSVQFNKPVILDPNGTKPYYFNFHGWEFASSIGAPQNVQSLNEPKASVMIDSGRGKITTNLLMTWIALYPHELPENIEISVDIDVERTDYFEYYGDQGFGLVCKWDDQPATRPGDDTGGYVLWVLRSIVFVTPYYVDEFGNAQDVGPVEFSDDRNYKKLLEGTKHHLMARCWNNQVDFIIDGEQVASYKTSDFRGYGNNKNGTMAGLMFMSGEIGSPAWIDNLQISWGLPGPTPKP